jgi:hypothetical protein
VNTLRNPAKKTENRADKLEEIKARNKSLKINPG